LYERVLEIEPDLKALLKSAKLASNEEKQLNLYERILEIEPENPEAKSIVSSRFIQLALLLAKISKSDDEQLMLYEPVLELEPDHETANKQRQIILQRQSKHSVKNIPLDSQIETLKTVFEEKLTQINTHIDETFANKVKATEKKQSASLIGVGAILIGIILIVVVVVFQFITLAKLEKSVMRFYSEQLQEQKEENQQLKEKNEKLDVEIQGLNEKLSPSSVKYQIKSTDTRLVYIVKKCYGYGENDKRKIKCAKLIEEYNNVSPTGLIAGEYLNIPNRPKEGCKLNRPPSCK
jgi:cell division protein FtsB